MTNGEKFTTAKGRAFRYRIESDARLINPTIEGFAEWLETEAPENMEDIIKSMRSLAVIKPLKQIVVDYADRVEAALKRERAIFRAMYGEPVISEAKND